MTGSDGCGDGRTVLLVGSGPIRIGQAAEFDYSGAQACRALREEGAEVVLVNSNPATIMTDPEMADSVYVEPITPEAIAGIIERERPDGVVAGLGGQTGLNVTAELAERGVLDEFGVEVMGTPLETIYATEDRERFRERMHELDQPVARSRTVESVDEVEEALAAVGGLPVIARTTYTLGGSGSGVVETTDALLDRVERGLRLSRDGQVMITESIAGWVELEYEVMRDAADSCLIVCNMENLDPMGIHTGESVVVTPSQVIPDRGHQAMRSAALEVIRDLGIEGGCNIQFAWRPDGTPGGEYRVVEVNPRVSRSSALASKATGYPIARVTAKVALGKRLHEIDNEITGQTTAAFEPAIDYVVTKVPRWPVEKFPNVEFELGTAMKSTGEAMAIGRTFEESLLKALRSSEYEPAVELGSLSDDELRTGYLERPTPARPYAVFEAFDRGYSVAAVADLTGIDEWYVERFENVAAATGAASGGTFEPAAAAGLTNRRIAELASETDDGPPVRADGTGDGGVRGVEGSVAVGDVEASVPDRSFRQVDTCAGEFAASTPYYYSARDPGDGGEGPDQFAPSDELQVDRSAESVVVVGGGPIRIGQGVEFDYCTVRAVWALREAGVEVHVVNNNPETVSTDYDTSDGLFFEPLTAEEIADVVAATGADGVMVQFGGNTSVEVADPLQDEMDRRGLDCRILGTSVEAMDLAEDRDRFNALLDRRGIAQPEGGAAETTAEAVELAKGVGYPVLVRPSYVLGGRAMEVVENDDELREYVEEAVRVSPDRPVLVDEFLADAVELDVDAVADAGGGGRAADGDTGDVLVGGVMEHVERAGVHSGDSACAIPPQSLSDGERRRVRSVVEEIAAALDTVGLLNVQVAVRDGEVYVLEANPRASRTVPFVSKATGLPLASVAAKVMAGATLEELDVAEQRPEQVSVKEVVAPFDRLPGSDPRLGPEMKSTGEVMGTADSFPAAYRKAQSAADNLPATGENAVAVVELPVEGFEDHFTVGSFEDVPAAVRDGEVALLVSDDPDALRAAVESGVAYCSTVEAAGAMRAALAAGTDARSVRPVSGRPRTARRWGE